MGELERRSRKLRTDEARERWREAHGSRSCSIAKGVTAGVRESALDVILRLSDV